MAAQKKTINVKEFYSDNLEEYSRNLQKVKPEAESPVILKANVSAEKALNAVEDVIKGKKQDDKRFNKNLIKLIAKKGVKPTVKKVYQNVLLTFFKTLEAEYDYSYFLNGNTINMSPKKISINEGYAEFTSATQRFVGDLGSVDRSSYPWEKVTDDMLTKTIESGYVIANLDKTDFEKDSKESMRQYNEKLTAWLKDFQQQQLGKARSLYNVTIYDKEYDYNELIMLVPYILVSYDLGDSIVTFPVSAVTGVAEGALLNNPAARFDYDESAVAPSFSIPLFILASLVMIIAGGVLYVLWYLNKKFTFKSKSLNGYTLSELKKLL